MTIPNDPNKCQLTLNHGMHTPETTYCAVPGHPNKLEFHTGRGPANFKEFLPFPRLGNPVSSAGLSMLGKSGKLWNI